MGRDIKCRFIYICHYLVLRTKSQYMITALPGCLFVQSETSRLHYIALIILLSHFTGALVVNPIEFDYRI